MIIFFHITLKYWKYCIFAGGIIIHKPLCTWIFPYKLKIAKVIPLYKNKTKSIWEVQSHVFAIFCVQCNWKNSFDQFYDNYSTNGQSFNMIF